MSKKSKRILAIIVALLAAVSCMFYFMPKHSYSSKIHNVVEVTDTGAEPSVFRTYLTIKEDGQYQIRANWWQEEMPGFITGLVVSDDGGKEIFSVTGGLLRADSNVMELKKGKYEFKFIILGSVEAYDQYVKENFDDSEMQPLPSDFFIPGVYEMDYAVMIEEAGGNYQLIGYGCGVVIGLLLSALVIVAISKGGEAKRKYDERQIAAQGKAFKLAFFTMIVYDMLLLLLLGAEIPVPADNAFLVFFGLLLSVAVFAIYSVLNDAYIALNESRRLIIGWFSVIALLNLVISAILITRGSFLLDGKLTLINSANLFCGAFIILFLAVLVIKGVRDKEED